MGVIMNMNWCERSFGAVARDLGNGRGWLEAGFNLEGQLPVYFSAGPSDMVVEITYGLRGDLVEKLLKDLPLRSYEIVRMAKRKKIWRMDLKDERSKQWLDR
jgi:hypothetical protein